LRYKRAMSPRGCLPTGALCLAVVAGMLGAAGCGDSSTDPGKSFLGTWHYDDGSGLTMCDDGNVNLLPSGNKTFEPGLMGGVVDTSATPLDPATYCDFLFDVSSNTKLTAHTGQACTLRGGSTYTVTDDQVGGDYYTFELNSATQAEELSIGTIHITKAGANVGDPPIMTTCKFNLIGHLTKVAKN